MAQNIGGGASLSYRYFTKRWLWMWFSILGFTVFPVHKRIEFPLCFLSACDTASLSGGHHISCIELIFI